MAANKEEIIRWLIDGIAEKATHMIVVCDTFDWDDYPVYVSIDMDVKETIKKIKNSSMQKVMEVYDLSKDLVPQLDANRTYEI